MGGPSDADPTQGESIDDAWTTESPAKNNDRTMHGFYAEPPIPRSDNHDRTTIGIGADRIVPATTDPSTSSIDQTLFELEESASSSVAEHLLVVLGRDGITIPREEEHRLVQPERSPLAFVIPDETPSAVPRARGSNDSSRFVMALIGDQPAPAVEADDVPVIPTMQPVMRRARLRRKWAAIGAAGVVSVVVAIKLATSVHAPRVTAPEVSAAPVATPAPTQIAPEPPKPSPVAAPVEPVAAPVPEPEPVAAAIAEPEPVATVPSTREAAVANAKPSEAPAKSSTPKKSSNAKHKSVAIAPTAAKKPSTVKKVTTVKSKPAEKAWSPKKRSF